MVLWTWALQGHDQYWPERIPCTCLVQAKRAKTCRDLTFRFRDFTLIAAWNRGNLQLELHLLQTGVSLTRNGIQEMPLLQRTVLRHRDSPAQTYS